MALVLLEEDMKWLRDPAHGPPPARTQEGTNYGPESMHTTKIKNLVPKFGFYSLRNSGKLLIINYLVYGVLLQKLKQTKAIVK